MKGVQTVIKTSVFPAAKEDVFSRLKEWKTLQYIAAPYASFTPEDGDHDLIWEENAVFSFHFKLFGLLPLGVHTIEVVSFSETGGIYTHEHNRHVPTWDHRIVLEPLGPSTTRYTDVVEIAAGWKTPLVYLWAKAFYAHRQRKWRKLLSGSGM